MTTHSIYAEARREADAFKWIESERAGRDLGEEALRCWARRYWRPFLRARLLEHLLGRRFWAELDRGEGDFGGLAGHEAGPGAEVLRMLRDGAENLDVILWARRAGADLEAVLRLLERADVNSRRLPHPLDR
jgi:hypothetical protein